jgi:hypothetical protein
MENPLVVLFGWEWEIPNEHGGFNGTIIELNGGYV